MLTPCSTQLVARLFVYIPESKVELNSSIGKLKPVQEVLSIYGQLLTQPPWLL